MSLTRVQIVVVVLIALAVGGGGFAAGMTVGPTLGTSGDAATQTTGGPIRRTGALPSGAPGAAGPAAALAQQTAGRVISVGDGSITVEVRQPGTDTTRSVIALVGDSARVVRTVEQEVKLGDIKAGDQVVVVGETDPATGAVSATAVIVGAGSLQQVFGGAGGTAPVRRPGASPTSTP